MGTSILAFISIPNGRVYLCVPALVLCAVGALLGCSGPTLNQYISESPSPAATAAVGGGASEEQPELVIEIHTATSSPAQQMTATQSAAETATATLLASTPTAADLPAATSTPLVFTSTPTRVTSSRPTAYAKPLGAPVAKVNIPSLSLRRYPLDDAPVVGAIREGYEYGVSALSRDGKWVRLETPIEVGGRGWVAARFVSVFGEITGILITDGLELGYNNLSLASNQAVANTGDRRLRLRGGPGTAFETVFFAFNGEVFTVLEESSDGNWVHLSNPSMKADGWAARQFIRLASDPIPTLRPSPTPTPTVLLTPPTPRPRVAPAGSTSTPTAAGSSSTQGGGQPLDATAEPAAPRATDSGATTATDNTSNTSNIVIVTNGARLMVRSAADPESEIVARVLNGESYSVVEVTEDGLWTQIVAVLSDGTEVRGWVSTRFTRPAGN